MLYIYENNNNNNNNKMAGMEEAVDEDEEAFWNFVIDTLWRENRKNQMNRKRMG